MSVRKAYERRRAAILQLHRQGLTVKGIMKTLNLPETTVRFHLSAANVKLLDRPSWWEEPRKRRKKPEPKRVEPKADLDLDNPVTLARIALGGRVTEKLGSYWLDGCPVGLDKLIQSANSELKEQGKPQIKGKETWEV